MNKSKKIVIAEAGVNHNGSIDTAIELIKAHQMPADIVKFQTFNTELFVTESA